MNWQRKKFAGLLKLFASILTGVAVENFEDQDFKKSPMPTQWDKIITRSSGHKLSLDYKEFTERVPMTYREFLQKLGTDAIRDGLHENAWVNGLFAHYNNASDNWIITDTRFPNEARSVLERNGILIRINRNVNTGDHPSETALDSWAGWTHVIDNNGSIDDLRDKLALIKF